MQELMTVIVTWLSVNFGLPAIYEHPRIEFVPMATMMEVRRARHASLQPDLAARTTLAKSPSDRAAPDDSDHGVHAIYDDLERTIYLPDGWTATSAAQVSILVHEMVHHLQNAGESTHACPEEREMPAYGAQASWLELLGTNLADEFGIDAMTLLVRTRCLY